MKELARSVSYIRVKAFSETEKLDVSTDSLTVPNSATSNKGHCLSAFTPLPAIDCIVSSRFCTVLRIQNNFRGSVPFNYRLTATIFMVLRSLDTTRASKKLKSYIVRSVRLPPAHRWPGGAGSVLTLGQGQQTVSGGCGEARPGLRPHPPARQGVAARDKPAVTNIPPISI